MTNVISLQPFIKTKAWLITRYIEAGRLFDEAFLEFQATGCKWAATRTRAYSEAMNNLGGMLDKMGGAL